MSGQAKNKIGHSILLILYTHTHIYTNFAILCFICNKNHYVYRYYTAILEGSNFWLYNLLDYRFLFSHPVLNLANRWSEVL